MIHSKFQNHFCTFRKYIPVCETGLKATIKVKTWRNLQFYNNNMKMPRICNKNEVYTLTNLCFCDVSAMIYVGYKRDIKKSTKKLKTRSASSSWHQSNILTGISIESHAFLWSICSKYVQGWCMDVFKFKIYSLKAWSHDMIKMQTGLTEISSHLHAETCLVQIFFF